MSSSTNHWSCDESHRTPFNSCSHKRKADDAADFVCEEVFLEQKKQCLWPANEDLFNHFQIQTGAFNGQVQNDFKEPNLALEEGHGCIVFETGVKEGVVLDNNNHASGADIMDCDIYDGINDTSKGFIVAPQSHNNDKLMVMDDDKTNASAGTISPNNGNLRCYCRPSWDAMVCTQPFLSDYY